MSRDCSSPAIAPGYWWVYNIIRWWVCAIYLWWVCTVKLQYGYTTINLSQILSLVYTSHASHAGTRARGRRGGGGASFPDPGLLHALTSSRDHKSVSAWYTFRMPCAVLECMSPGYALELCTACVPKYASTVACLYISMPVARVHRLCTPICLYRHE